MYHGEEKNNHIKRGLRLYTPCSKPGLGREAFLLAAQECEGRIVKETRERSVTQVVVTAKYHLLIPCLSPVLMAPDIQSNTYNGPKINQLDPPCQVTLQNEVSVSLGKSLILSYHFTDTVYLESCILRGTVRHALFIS